MNKSLTTMCSLLADATAKRAVEKTCTANVVVGTPDMIEKEIYKRHYLDISALNDLVFDEAYDLIKLDVVIGKPFFHNSTLS